MDTAAAAAPLPPPLGLDEAAAAAAAEAAATAEVDEVKRGYVDRASSRPNGRGAGANEPPPRRMLEEEGDRLQEQEEALAQTPAYARMAEQRQSLPAAAAKVKVLASVGESEVVVISGETGCGTTTHVPPVHARPTLTLPKSYPDPR